ncbi:MAG: M24 family metallopeptidase [Acidimicrobiales bacterium]
MNEAKIPVDRSALGQESTQQFRGVDLERMRYERYGRLQAEMRKRDIGVLVLTDLVNVRYATGLAVSSLWNASHLSSYVMIPVTGDPVVYGYPEALYRSNVFWNDVRPARHWQYRFSGRAAQDVVRDAVDDLSAAIKERGLTGERVGVDRLDAFGFFALTSAGIEICDADEAVQAARMVKTWDELEVLKQSVAVGEAALYQLETAIRPGISENELLAVMWGEMLRLGGEYCSTRLVASGSRTNPWFQEASSKLVRPGDLVAVDTDMIGPEGYACDVSRTFLCGRQPTAQQREAYHVARDFITGVASLLRPGIGYRELLRSVTLPPEQYREQAYSSVVHGLGMEDESPYIGLADIDGDTPDEELVPNMVLCVECYAGIPGLQDGVKLEDEYLITADGAVRLSQYPLDEVLGA